jgi:hypothetical protein
MNLIDYNFRLNSIIKEGILTTNEIALMFVIINLQNTLRSDLFGLPTRTTSAHLNLSHPTYYRTLEGLQIKGLIAILEQGKKNQAPIIRITFDKKILANPFSISQFETNAIKENEQMLLKNFSESVHISNKEERRKNKKESTNNNKLLFSSKESKIQHPKSTMEPVEKINLETMGDYLTEQITENYYLLKQATGYETEKLIRSIQPFILHQQLQQTKYLFRTDVYKHFARWIRTFDVDREQPNQPTKKAGEMTADEIAKWVSNQIHKNHDH